MPVNQHADYYLNGRPYMLVRGGSKGRAWSRTGTPDVAGRRSSETVKYGNLPDEIDRPEVWDDWSGGAFEPYRRSGENTYHWAENFDARFPRQLIHAQNARILCSVANPQFNGARIWVSPEVVIGSIYYNCNAMLDGWTAGSTYVSDQFIPRHLRSIWFAGKGWWSGITPQDPTLSSYDFAEHLTWVTGTTGGLYAGGADTKYGHRMEITGSYLLLPCHSATFALGVQRNGVPAVMNGLNGITAFAGAGKQLWKIGRPQASGADQALYLQNCDIMADCYASANWGATFYLSSSDAPLLDIISFEDQIAVSNSRGLYIGDATGTFSNALDVAALGSHPENGRDLTIWNSGIVYPHVGGIWHVRVDELATRANEIGPLAKLADRSPLQGRIRAVRGYGQWLLAGLYTGSRSHLLAGRMGNQGIIWHTLNRFPGVTKVSRLHVDGAVYASNYAALPSRLWAAMDADIDTGGTAPIYWQPITPGFGNALAPAMNFTPNYVGSARMDLGAVDGDAPGTAKVYRAVEMWAENLASGAQWADVYYTIDGGTRTKLGTVARSPKDTLYFPASSGSFLTGQSIALSLESYTASPAVTPIYKSLVLRWTARPKSIDQITAVTRIADLMADRMGAPMRPGAAMVSELRTLAEQNQPVQLIDLAGATSWVVVQAPVQEEEYYQQGDDEPEIAARVRLTVMEFQ